MNSGTAIAAFLLAVAVVLVIRKMAKDRRAGRGGCSCGCSGCAFRGTCHQEKKND